MNYSYISEITNETSPDPNWNQLFEPSHKNVQKIVQPGKQIYFISSKFYDTYFNDIVGIKNNMKSGIIKTIDWDNKKIIFIDGKKITNMIILDLTFENKGSNIPLLNSVYYDFVKNVE
jgi:hypothetical protein